METLTITKTVFPFDELSDEAQEKALEKYHDINTDYEWYEGVYEDAKTIGDILGIDIDNIYFSGFSSQGDGACFEGSYSHRKGSVKKIKEYAPENKELHLIALELSKLQSKYFYQIHASVKHSGHYYHSGCINLEVWIEEHPTMDYTTLMWDEDDYNIIRQVLREFMDWIYNQLDKEYEHLTSEDSIVETFKSNEYEFDKDGNIAYQRR